MFHHLIEEMGDTADACGKHHTYLVEVGVDGGEVRTFHRLLGRYQGKLRIQVVFAHVLAVEILQRIVILDLSSEMGLEIGGIEMSNRSNAVLTLRQAFPKILDIVSDRCDGPKAGDDYSVHGIQNLKDKSQKSEFFLLTSGFLLLNRLCVLFLLFFNQLDHITHSDDVLLLIVRNRNTEFLFEIKHQFNSVQ